MRSSSLRSFRIVPRSCFMVGGESPANLLDLVFPVRSKADPYTRTCGVDERESKTDPEAHEPVVLVEGKPHAEGNTNDVVCAIVVV